MKNNVQFNSNKMLTLARQYDRLLGINYLMYRFIPIYNNLYNK